MDIAGSVIWALVFGLGGFYFAHGLELMMADVKRHKTEIVLSIFLVVMVVLWRRQKREMVETVEAFSHPTAHGLHSVEEMGEKWVPPRDRANTR